MGLKPTLAILDQKLDQLLEISQKHNVMLEGSNGTPGLRIRVDRIEQREQDRRWSFRLLWGAIVTTLVSVLFRTGGGGH